MEIIREINFYEHYFDEFFDSLSEKVKNKVDEVLFLIATVERIPKKFFDRIETVKGLYEIRVEFEGNIYSPESFRDCCFDKGKLIVHFNGFQKKKQKTPKKEIEKAEKLMKEYFKQIKD